MVKRLWKTVKCYAESIIQKKAINTNRATRVRERIALGRSQVNNFHMQNGGIADVADYSSSQETSTMRFSKSGMRKKIEQLAR